ncbi:MAG: hypothetical protein QW403_03085 [Candidatus Aenigmatarchaeota archaeon]
MQVEKVEFYPREELERIINKNYGAKIDLRDYVILLGKENKIWICSKKIFEVDLKKLKVNSFGLYFGKIKRNEKIHLSPEGAQIVGKNAVRNVLELSKDEARKFMEGSDLKIKIPESCEPHNFVILKRGDDILGCSLALEDGIKNLLPKSRRIISSFKK